MKTNILEKKLHAKYSASGSERWLNCPGSVRLAAMSPPAPDNKYAVEGTAAHECLEMLMKNKFKAAQTAKLLEKQYPSSMVNHALEAFRTIYKLVPKDAELLCETEVRLDFVHPGMFGTVDAAIVELFGTLYVIDYKYGAGRLVNPKDNTQGIYYALGLAHKYDFNFEKIVIGILQPRIVHKDGYFRTWELSPGELKTWALKFKKGIEACEDEFADINPGRWCYFCPAQDNCPAVNEDKNQHVQSIFD